MSLKRRGLGLTLGLFFLQQQFHFLLSLPDQISMLSAGIHQENLGRETTVSKELSIWVKIGRKHEMKAVAKHGGAVGGHGGGGGGGEIPSNGGGENNGGGQGAAVIPVYAAGANHNRYHHNHGSNSGHVYGIGYICFTLLASFFCVLYI